MQKILLIGSAPEAKDWYLLNGPRYTENGFKICPINNAWSFCEGNIFFWFRAEDFFFIPNTIKPTDAQREKWFEIVRNLDFPFFYDKGRAGGTMLLNTLCHLLNHSFFCKVPFFIAVAGSDLIYKTDRPNHFYGEGGTPDPLNLGVSFLQDQLRIIKTQAEQLGCSIVNVGGQPETLLPFARYQIE